ncbi:J domain-containing protein [Aspergillus ibericus CBS 121593]|uniref:J domain-containing protein n=1 Tax=Aspergillus ibericus CBS 121593 TaxID=1448316 RepID=A0A395GSU2_9EURO|nr:hypothetical protein BO80DRAFT_447388 [Aspergillus ibericus CBS 121593]RAK98509.1 hypothetical protein BO80DRAFT_447388 [Aspergillus ibericus CBS 121593]
MEIRITLPLSTILTSSHLSLRSRRASIHGPSIRPLHGDANPNHTQQPSFPPWPSPLDLTPYSILGLHPRDPYTKTAFYKLVKLYHPDRYQTVPSDLSPTIREHRYRLVVAAHELLSNPQKRLAYDRYGVGWRGQGPPRTARVSRHPNHATSHGTEGENLLPHPRLVILFLVIAFFLQSCLFVVRAQKAEMHARQVHVQSQRLLDRRRSRAAGLGGLGIQVERFLLKRDPSGLGVTGQEALVYREMLPYCTFGGA